MKRIEFRSRVRRATALPDNRRSDWFERLTLPQQRRLALIRNRNRADILDADLSHNISGRIQLRLPDLVRRLFNPARSRKVGLDAALRAREHVSALVPDEGAAGRGPLIEGEEQPRSYASSSSSRRRPMTTRATAAKTARIAPTPIIRFIVRPVLLAATPSCGP